jgi:WD40 repeat protein
MPVMVAAAFALLLVAGVVVSAWQAVRARQAEGEAVVQRDEATKKRQEAEAARELARKSETDLHRLYYAQSTRVVQAAWESHNIWHVRDLLAETANFPERGFEWYYWQRLSHIEHLTLVGHKGAVTAVAFAPNGQRLVTGGKDGTARIWDTDSGHELHCLRGHRREITAVAFAPDGHWLVTSSTDGTARIWDAASGQELRTLQRENAGPLWAIAVMPDGKRVVTGSEDRTARVWDAASGQIRLTIQGHTDLPVLGASTVALLSSLHARGPFLAASALSPGRTGHIGRVWAVAATPDGRRLVTGSEDGTVRIWDASNGRELLRPLAHTGEVFCVAISADGKWLVTGSGGQSVLKLWDVASGRELSWSGQCVSLIRSVTTTPDGKWVVAGNGKIWDRASGGEIRTLYPGPEDGTCVAVSPDGQRLAIGSLEGTARVWETASGRRTLTLKTYTGLVASVALTPDEKRIVTGGADGTRLWDAVSGRQLRKLEQYTEEVWAVAVTPNGQRIVTGEEHGTVRLWDATSGDELLTLKGHTGQVRCITGTPDGQRIITGADDGRARLWDVASRRQLLNIKAHLGRVNSLCVTPDGQRFLTGGYEGTAKVWDAVSGRLLLTLKGHTHAALHFVAVMADSRRFVTGSGDGTVAFWDGASCRKLLSLKGHSGVVWSFAVTPDGQRIVTGGEDGTVRLWDSVNGRELLTLKGHTGSVWSVAATSDGRRLISGSDDGTVKIWEAASPEQVAFWDKQDQEAARRHAAWQRPTSSTPGFIQDWLILAPLAREDDQTGAERLEREQLAGETRLQPRAGDRVQVNGQEYTGQAHREKEPILDFNRIVGELCNRAVAYAVCYVVSEMDRNDLLLQVGSDDQAKIYLNGQEVYKKSLASSLNALDPVGPVTLRKGTNVLVLKVVNHAMTWEGCARFVDREGNPVPGLQVRLTPE